MSSTWHCRVYRLQAENAPDVIIDAEENSLYTLVLTNLDGHFTSNNSEYLHWMMYVFNKILRLLYNNIRMYAICSFQYNKLERPCCTPFDVFRSNIRDGDIKTGSVLCDYLRPFPAKGTGWHRYVFLLFKQSKDMQYPDIKCSSERYICLSIFMAFLNSTRQISIASYRIYSVKLLESYNYYAMNDSATEVQFSIFGFIKLAIMLLFWFASVTVYVYKKELFTLKNSTKNIKTVSRLLVWPSFKQNGNPVWRRPFIMCSVSASLHVRTCIQWLVFKGFCITRAEYLCYAFAPVNTGKKNSHSLKPSNWFE